MSPQALFDLFRSDVVDTALPYLWTDEEVWEYLDDSYIMFVRLRGGIPDATSDVARIPIVTGEAYAAIDPRIMKIRRAFLASTSRPLTLVNVEDEPISRIYDYGAAPVMADNLPGPVQYMVIGEEESLVRWVQVPVADDTANLVVYRLPLNTISASSSDTDMNEVQPHHHRHFLKWMKHRAYGKQDAETFDKGRSDAFKQSFEDYCELAKAEMARAKSKVRTVAYGGL